MIRDFALKLLFDSEHQLDCFQAIDPKIVHEAGIVTHLRFVDAELLDNNGFGPRGDVTHYWRCRFFAQRIFPIPLPAADCASTRVRCSAIHASASAEVSKGPTLVG